MSKRYVSLVTEEQPQVVVEQLNALFNEADNPKHPVQSAELIGIEHVGAFWFAWIYIVEK